MKEAKFVTGILLTLVFIFIFQIAAGFTEPSNDDRNILEKEQAEKEKQEQNGKKHSIKGLSVGDKVSDVKAVLGEPRRKDESEHDFDWYIYNEKYKEYLQVGIKNNEVVALLGTPSVINSPQKNYNNINREDVHSYYGDPNYKSEHKDGYAISSDGDNVDYKIGFYYDSFDNDQVYLAKILSDNYPLFSYNNYGDKSQEYFQDMEKQIIDQINVLRSTREKSSYYAHEGLNELVRTFSQSMAENNHSFSDIVDSNLDIEDWSINIAKGQNNALEIVNSWLNSPSNHREIIFEDFTFASVGTTKTEDEEISTILKAVSIENNEDIDIYVDGKRQEFERLPRVVDGSVIVPLGTLFNRLDVQMEWEPETKTIIAKKEGNTLKLQVDKKEYYFNDKKEKLNTPVEEIEDVIFVPLRVISENFDYKVTWNADYNLIIIE
ncbi:stalk domain-containing protein [Natranaerofaba carboxydovora]|uniref:stalk domain-containing protein n=1 Tax=Natranaerofaba carboxydovora TaxID=2742683 RepID=UPI001F1384C7|nr:stalk domain-containing protein [Natranaerofaba carboxydovora]UMZ73810.1 hypothetical protein ACONDI_01379 [Natranaerofaba carboxydovora]